MFNSTSLELNNYDKCCLVPQSAITDSNGEESEFFCVRI